MTHKIVVVYQSLLDIYSDRGNAKVLVKRLQWRGIPAELVDTEPGRSVPDDGLVYLLGGGEDWAQIAAVRELEADRGLHRGLDAGGVLFAVCAGPPDAGQSYGQRRPPPPRPAPGPPPVAEHSTFLRKLPEKVRILELSGREELTTDRKSVV